MGLSDSVTDDSDLCDIPSCSASPLLTPKNLTVNCKMRPGSSTSTPPAPPPPSPFWAPLSSSVSLDTSSMLEVSWAPTLTTGTITNTNRNTLTITVNKPNIGLPMTDTTTTDSTSSNGSPCSKTCTNLSTTMTWTAKSDSSAKS